jgi:DNA-binding transcriptional LysR family regulator
MILKGHLEIALTSVAPRSPELMAEFCLPMKLVAFAAKGYPIAQEKQLSLADLEKIPLIIRNDASKRGITETLLLKLRSLGYRPNIVMRCESPEWIKTAVSKKLGVGILYQDVLNETNEGRVVCSSSCASPACQWKGRPTSCSISNARFRPAARRS